MATILGYGPIPWDALATFSGSAATLIAGFAAVIAAYKVGKRQVEIAERQTAILDKQTDTDYRRLQSELYDRRLNVYARIMAFLEQIRASDSHICADDISDYRAVIIESSFLFSATIHAHLEDSAEVVLQSIMLTNVYIQNRDKYSLDESAPERYIETTQNKLIPIREKLRTLFFAEMKLDIPPPPPGFQSDNA